MAKTQNITLIYQITQKAIVPPSARELARKDEWIKELQRTVEADYKPLQIRVMYKIFNPEVEQLRRFFHTCIKYFVIQHLDMVEGEPDNHVLEQWREELLDELIGYDYQTANKVLRKRVSTETYKDTQPWLTLLKNFEETLFESHGYEFPNSEDFWVKVKEHGYEEAQRIAITGLQIRMNKKII